MTYVINDKARNISQLNRYMLAKTLSMFDYSGLPDSVPQKELEKILQTHGYAFYTEIDDVPYVLWGGMGGELDEYYNPTEIVIHNPALGINNNFNINEDGVLIKNDDMEIGLLPLFERFNTLMIENQINMDMHGFNSRALKLISASDDRTKESAELFLKKLRNGESAVIGDNAMFEGVKVHTSNSGGGSTLVHLIEYQQYLKAALYNEVGISAPSNMKRERLNSGEVNQQEDALMIFVDSMLKCRKEAIQKINEKYSENIEVKFSGAWERKDEAESESRIIVPD